MPSKEVHIIRRKRKPSEVFVGEKKIILAQEFAKPKDQDNQGEKNPSWREEYRSQERVSNKVPEIRKNKIKPGSTQESQHPISAKEIKTGKMTGDGGGSYDTDMQSFAKKAAGKEYQEEKDEFSNYHEPQP